MAGLEFVKIAYPEIDSERMCMLGASYGGQSSLLHLRSVCRLKSLLVVGYMANWIQGHNDVMGFKAIVCHDGVFSTSGTWYTTDELYVPALLIETESCLIDTNTDTLPNENSEDFPGTFPIITTVGILAPTSRIGKLPNWSSTEEEIIVSLTERESESSIRCRDLIFLRGLCTLEVRTIGFLMLTMGLDGTKRC